jgi:hypothetical protein
METGMNCNIKWNTLSIDQWEEKFSQISHSNILQSYDYARAACPFYKQKARWGLIEIQGREAGLVQLFETGLFGNIIHAVMVDRGPLWFDGFGTALHVKLFFDELNKQFPKRFGRKRRMIPETEGGPTAHKLITQTGLLPVANQTGYQTVWIDLDKDEDTLRAELRPNWRNAMNKAERSGITIEWDDRNQTLDWVTGIYAADKSMRGYNGIPPKLLKNYATILAPKQGILIGRAMLESTPIAFVVFVMHGRSATYLAGWSSEEGRGAAAHHALLWNGMRELKKRNIRELDMGGINDEEASGIKNFKEGLGGRVVRTVGQYA